MKTRKMLIIVLIALVLGTTGAFAKGITAIGAEGGVDFLGGMPMGGMILFQVPQVPIMWGVGVNSSLDIGLTGDYHFAKGSLGSIFGWYAGIGGYVNLGFDSFSLTAGARVPLALQMWPFGKKLELFLEVAPALGVSIIPTGFDPHVQGAFGVRYWF